MSKGVTGERVTVLLPSDAKGEAGSSFGDVTPRPAWAPGPESYFRDEYVAVQLSPAGWVTGGGTERWTSTLLGKGSEP